MKIKLSLLATGLLYVPVVFAQKQPNVVIILADMIWVMAFRVLTQMILKIFLS